MVKKSVSVNSETGEVLTRLNIRSNFNPPREGEKVYHRNTMPSKTRPGEAISMRTLYDRYATGQPLGMGKQPIYEEETGIRSEHGINPRTLDLCDWEQMRLRNAERITELKAKEFQERQEKQRLRKEAAAKAKEQAEKLKTNPEGTNIS